MDLRSTIRVGDWYSRLVQIVEDTRRVSFEWRTHDCGMDWAGRAVWAMLNVDMRTVYTCDYTNAVGAYKYLQSLGFSSIDELLESHLNCMHPSKAILGDLALVEDDSVFKYAIGIVNGSTILVRGDDGLRIVDLRVATKAYALGLRV